MKKPSYLIGHLAAISTFSMFAQNIPMVEIPPIPQEGSQRPSNNGEGPETINIDKEKIGTQGNWMKKREWLIESNKVFDEIQDIALSVQEIRKSFNAKYHAIDRELDGFYQGLSLNQGKLQAIFDSIERYLEKKRTKELEKLSAAKSTISDRDYILKIDLINTEIKQHKDELEQLKLDLSSVEDLKKSLIERVKKVDQQIAQVQEVYNSAKTTIEELWYVIDDKKARLTYYDLKGRSLEILKSIQSYLQQDLTRDFETVLETTRSQMHRVKESIAKLEEKGVIIKNRTNRVEVLKIQQQEAREKAKKEAKKIPVKEEVIDLKKMQKPPMAWYEKIYHYIKTQIESAYTWSKGVASAFFGSKQKQPSK